MKLQIPRFLLVVCLFFFGITCLPAEVVVSRHPYIQNTTKTSAAILWRTIGGTIPIIRYGTAPDMLVNEVLPVSTVIKLAPSKEGPAKMPRLHSAPENTFQYETTIHGLTPATKYYYGVYDNEELLVGGDENHYFNTLPEDDSTEPLRLLVIGDSGRGTASQIAGFREAKAWVVADGKPIDAFLHLGDMAYNSGHDFEFADNFFGIYQDLLRNTVTWPTMGNHEGLTSSGVTQIGPYYDSFALPTQAEAGGEPSGTEAYYSFDMGRAHFVCLNSHDLSRLSTSEMALWLRADLEMADADWLIAFWHHPPYTKGSHDSDRESQLIEMRTHIMPILEAAGVDLVLCGHSHIYERSMLIDGAYATPTVAEGHILDDGDGSPNGDGAYRKSASLNPNEGTVAMVAGNGYTSVSSPNPCVIMRSVISEVGSVMIDIDGDTLTSRMINVRGVGRDEFQIVKQGKVEQQVVEFPWQPRGSEQTVERLEPGVSSVTITPSTVAPDAVIHYTTDATTPTTASPIYTGPVETDNSEDVRAITVWRDGTRISPVTSGYSLPDYLSIVRFPLVGADDAREDADTGEVVLDELGIDLGAGIAGFRFDDLRIPAEAYLVNASIWFESANASQAITEGSFWAELSPDSAPFVAVPNDLSSRDRTVFTASWNPGSWFRPHARDANTTSPIAVEFMREILALPGWESGNAMSFFATQSSPRVAEAVEVGRVHSAELSVVYIDPEGLVEQLGMEETEVGFSAGRYLLGHRWPTPPAANQFGMSFVVERSSDMKTWEPTPLVNAGFGFQDISGFGRLVVELDPSAFEDEPRVYFRFRIFQGAPQ